jgi:two-component system OmpR family sensor kinase
VKKLHWRIYFALLVSLLVFGAVIGGIWRQVFDPPADLDELSAGELQAILPPADAPEAEYARPLARLAANWGSILVVSGPGGERLAASPGVPNFERFRGLRGDGRRFQRHEEHRIDETPLVRGRFHWPERFREFELADGRRVRVWQTRPFGRRPPHPLYALALVVLATAASSYFVARSLTRRLERLQSGVEAFGSGNLKARAPVEGSDEVAGLARSFNQAAERVEQLVDGHKNLMANASHELRSPLARLRLAVELLPDSPPEKKDELESEATRSLREIDLLVEEILLSSRLEALAEGAVERTPVDLVALVREESEALGATVEVSGEPGVGAVDERLVRRALRNLVENAFRHGSPPVGVGISRAGGMVYVRVSDRGPGVPEAERERIFEPFYRRPGKSESQSGAGLGLALVRRIARAHGGDVDLEGLDTLDARAGAVFELRLAAPVVPADG